MQCTTHLCVHSSAA